MQNNSKGNFYSERNLNRFRRRTSTSGFDYPEDLGPLYSNVDHPHSHLDTLQESGGYQYPPDNIFRTINGDCQKSEITSQNFFSENNVNFMNRSLMGNMSSSTLDPRYYYNDSGPIPRFSSTPFIAQTSSDCSHNQNNFNDVKMKCNESFQPPPMYNNSSNMYQNRQNNSNSQTYTNGDPFPYPQYVLYDLRTNSYQNVVFYSPNTPAINSSDHDPKGDNSLYYNNGHNLPQTCEYQTLVTFPSEKPLKDNYLDCQLNMAQQNMDMELIPEFVKEDLMYFLPPDLPKEVCDITRAESQSMPSLHGDDNVESDFDSSEDDQRDTVHDEEMLQELQKMSSVFTNVVNLPMSRNSDTMSSTEFEHHHNLSRFKKTRIKERIHYWRHHVYLVKETMVKIIPDKVLDMKLMDLDRLNQYEIDIFECQISKEANNQQPMTDPPDCIHSQFRCRSTPLELRYLKHSSRTSQKYRPSFNALSPNDLNNSVNQQMPSNISSRYSHRKSLQIPLRIPIVWNPVIPLLSPAVQHRSRMFFDSPVNCNGKSSRRRRRWSVSGTKFERNGGPRSSRPHNLRHAGDLMYPVKYDLESAHYDNRQSFDLHDLEECTHDRNSHICSILESKLDKQLVSLKRTILSYVECNISEIKDEIKSLKGTQISLEKELQFYKEKVNNLEESVRLNLPHDQWGIFGISDSTSSEQ